MGPWERRRVVPRYSPPGPPLDLPTPGTPSPTVLASQRRAAVYGRVNEVVGLKSVAQLTSEALFSDLRGITEVYNLPEVEDR